MTDTACCKNCGEPLKGSFCYKCGEKRLTDEDRSVSHWFQDTLSQIVQLDGKVIRAISSMIYRPAKLASQYHEGVRKPYLKMANLFLIANLLYFLTPGLQTFKTSLRVQVNQQLYSDYAERVVDHYLERNDTSFEELEKAYNTKTTEVSKLLLILLVLLLGLSIHAVFFKQMFLADAFNLALQFWSAYIIMFILPFSILILINQNVVSLGKAADFLFSEWVLSGATLLFSGIYLWEILRKFSKRWWHHLLRLLVILASFIVIFTLYRVVLFLITMIFV